MGDEERLASTTPARTRQRIGRVATTSAMGVSPRRIETSPKKSPRASRARSVPSTTMAASPSRITWNPEPLMPWRRIRSPSPKTASSKVWTMPSSCGAVRSANSANPAMASTSSSRPAIRDSLRRRVMRDVARCWHRARPARLTPAVRAAQHGGQAASRTASGGTHDPDRRSSRRAAGHGRPVRRRRRRRDGADRRRGRSRSTSRRTTSSPARARSGPGSSSSSSGGARVDPRRRRSSPGSGPGEFFGELSVLDGRPRVAQVVADGPTTCLALASWDFEAVAARGAGRRAGGRARARAAAAGPDGSPPSLSRR